MAIMNNTEGEALPEGVSISREACAVPSVRHQLQAAGVDVERAWSDALKILAAARIRSRWTSPNHGPAEGARGDHPAR